MISIITIVIIRARAAATSRLDASSASSECVRPHRGNKYSTYIHINTTHRTYTSLKCQTARSQSSVPAPGPCSGTLTTTVTITIITSTITITIITTTTITVIITIIMSTI